MITIMCDGAFVHLHVHTHYSLLDGATRIKPLVERAKEMNMPAVAITDHGNMFGAIEFYNAAVQAGVKPIIGCETYIAPGDRRVKGSNMKEASYHLLLLARNNEGYQNLLKLASIGYLEGFYYRPRIDKETLREHSAGLLCTSTCLSAEIPRALLRHDRKAAENAAKTYLDIFGPERFFIEIQQQGLDEEGMINPELVDIANRLGVAVVATNDVHYLESEDAPAHDVLCCISTRNLITDENRLKFPTDQFYFKSPEEMRSLFPQWPDAIENTLRVADVCNVDLNFTTRHSPVYRIPAEHRNISERNASDSPAGERGSSRAPKTQGAHHPEDAYLRELVYQGARRKYGQLTEEITERIEYELSIIAGKGFSGYFLIVWDFMSYARSRDIPCTARGSGCSSVVSYCLDISAPDPLHYGLYFERFMDPDRDEMPDIDVDICQNHRGEVIEYVRRKYGHVAQIITFGTLKAKAAVKDVARVMGMGFKEAGELTNLIPAELNITIDRALEIEPELKGRYQRDPTVKEIIDLSRKVEGLARHAGVHAAGIVVSDQPLNAFLPLYKPPNEDQIVTQYDGPTVEKVGLLKFDFLGLRTLTTIERARQLASESAGRPIDLEHLDLTDQRVYELFARGDTKGIFQFESGGMRDAIMRMKPNRIEDLIAANALFRPGPMQYIDAYIARKHGEHWTTAHPKMTEVLGETYGIMVYQEQVSRIVNQLGGIELKRAFRLAKAISKKKTAMIEAMREPFFDGCAKNGMSRGAAKKVFEDILKFGGYAFNKAHSTGYALLAFKTAYLKTYHPVEFMAALLTFEMSSSAKVMEYIEECKHLGITVQPPDINTSQNGFTVDTHRQDDRTGPVIRFGLEAVKGVGAKAVDAIRRARPEGRGYRSIFDFCERVDLTACNRSAIEALINCGAFDSTGSMRKALSMVLDSAIEHGNKTQRDKRTGQLGLFASNGDGDEERAEPPLPADEWNESEMLAREKAALGFYVTRHPLTASRELIESCATCCTADLATMAENTPVCLGGMVSSMRTLMTRNGKKMGIVTFEDLKGSVEAVVFARDLEKFRSLLTPDSIVFLEGQVDRRREAPSVRVSNVIPERQATRILCHEVHLAIPHHSTTETTLVKLAELLGRYPGDKEVFLKIRTTNGGDGPHLAATLRCARKFSIDYCDEFSHRALELLGPGAVRPLGRTRRLIPIRERNGDSSRSTLS